MRRLLPARVGIADSPAQAHAAIEAHGVPDLLLLEDRAWPESDEAALAALRSLSAARKLGLILSRRRGDRAHSTAWPQIVERPYDLAEVTSAMRAALLRRSAR